MMRLSQVFALVIGTFLAMAGVWMAAQAQTPTPTRAGPTAVMRIPAAADPFATAEAEAARLAQAAREAKPDSPERQKAAEALAKAVEKSFDTRQTGERAEADRLAAELKRVTARLEEREKLKADIVGRRVRELLGDRSLSWTDGSDGRYGQYSSYTVVPGYAVRNSFAVLPGQASGFAPSALPPAAVTAPAAPKAPSATLPTARPLDDSAGQPQTPDDLVAMLISAKSDQDKARVRRLLEARRQLVDLQLREEGTASTRQQLLLKDDPVTTQDNPSPAESRVRRLEVLLSAYDDLLKGIDAPSGKAAPRP